MVLLEHNARELWRVFSWGSLTVASRPPAVAAGETTLLLRCHPDRSRGRSMQPRSVDLPRLPRTDRGAVERPRLCARNRLTSPAWPSRTLVLPDHEEPLAIACPRSIPGLGRSYGQKRPLHGRFCRKPSRRLGRGQRQADRCASGLDRPRKLSEVRSRVVIVGTLDPSPWE